MADQIADHGLGDHELAVGEQLDQQRRQQGVVGRADRDRRRGAQARGEVRQADRPGRRPAGARSAADARPARAAGCRAAAAPPRRRPARPDRAPQRAGSARRRAAGGSAAASSQRAPRARRPDPREMALAAARRAVQDQRRRRPVGPAREPGERLLIARRRHEVLDAASPRDARTPSTQLLAHGCAPPRAIPGRARSRDSAEREADQHADHRGDRHREQRAEQAEQHRAGEHREDHPDRMEVDPVADQARRDQIAFDELAEREHRRDQRRS